MKSYVLLAVVLLRPLLVHASEELAAYDFSGEPGNQSSTSVGYVASNIAASSLGLGVGLTPLATVNTSTGTQFSTALSLDFALNDYWQFTITPAAAFACRVDSVDFSYIRSSQGPKSLSLRSDKDAYAIDIASAATGIPAGYQAQAMDLAQPVYTDEAVTYRIFGYAAGSTGGSGALAGNQLLRVNGEVRPLLAKYQFTGAVGNEPGVGPAGMAAGMKSYPLVRGPGLVATTAANTLAASGWTTGPQSVAGDYIEFTISPVDGSYAIEALLFGEFNTASGPSDFAIRTSLDGFQSDVVPVIHRASSGSYARKHAITLDERFQNLRVPVIFRFYAWGASSGSGIWGLGGVQPEPRLVVVGSVLSHRLSAIPVPAAVTQTATALGKTIFNDDGDFTYDPAKNNATDWQNALNGMLNQVSALQAGKETLAYALQTSDVMLYPTTVGSKWGWDPASLPSNLNDLGVQAKFPAAVQGGCDGVMWAGQKAMVMQCGFVPVYRVNDAHYLASSVPYLESKFWRDNPGLRLPSAPFSAQQDPGNIYGKLFDYAEPALVAHKLALVSEAIDRYKGVMDGFELDFLRSPPCFLPDVAWAKRADMTGFVGSVRAELNEAQTATGRTCRLLVRVPSSIESCENLGLDIRKWVADGLVQVVIPAQIMTLQHDTPLDEFMEVCRPAGVAVYPALYRRVKKTYPFDALLTSPMSGSAQNATDTLLHGAILNHRAMLADGFEIYNFNLPLSAAYLSVFKRIEIAQMTSPRVYAVTPADDALISTYAEGAKQLPFRIDPVATTKICNLYVGEDPAAIPVSYYIGLRIGFNKEDMNRSWVALSINGVAVPLTTTDAQISSTSPSLNPEGPFSYLQIKLPASVLRKGYNDFRLDYKMTAQDIAFAIGPDENTRKRIIVTEVQLGVLPSSP